MVRAGGASPRLRGVLPVQRLGIRHEELRRPAKPDEFQFLCRRRIPQFLIPNSSFLIQKLVILCQNRNVITMKSWA